jgi:hypothetical protein
MNKANPFANRILGYGVKSADQFMANPHNYRKHPQRQRDAVQASLRELGWIGVVVENVTTGQLIDGHERVWQALAGNEDVPYIQVELSPDEEKLALAVFDPITHMAEIDGTMLNELLQEINTGEAALQELLESMAIDAGLVEPNPISEMWQGMPSFEQDEQLAYQTIKVHFDRAEDVKRFAELMEQTITHSTKFIWYPRKERLDLKEFRVESNES